VILPDGMNLNQELVKRGWYWWYGEYAPGDTMSEGLECEAREGRKGLWANPQPVPPWGVVAAEQVSSAGQAGFFYPSPHLTPHDPSPPE
jgi:micrococcal nuclease